MKRIAFTGSVVAAIAIIAAGGACRQESWPGLRHQTCTGVLSVPALPDGLAAWAHNQRGLAAYEQGQHAKALNEFRTATERNPAHAGAWNNLGNVHRSLRDLGKAEAAYTHAIAAKPRYGRALHNRSAVRFARGDRPGALADAHASVALQPKAASPLAVRGNIRLALGDYAGARADQSRAVALTPAFLTSFHNRACARAAGGNLAGAARDLVRATANHAPGAFVTAYVDLRLDFRLGRASERLTGTPDLQRMDCGYLALPHQRHAAGRVALGGRRVYAEDARATE